MADAPARLMPGPKPRTTCSKCNVPLTVDNAVPAKRNRDGLSSTCRSCHTAATRAWQAANPEKVRANDRRRYLRSKAAGSRPSTYDPKRERIKALMRRYNLTPERYDEMLAEQEGGCGICRRPPGTRPLAVDHNHVTGVVRGLLCAPCNMAVSCIDRCADWTERAIAYLGGRRG